jgi:ATP-dependent DNA helicase RecG
MGERQSGDPFLRFANLILDQDLVAQATQAASRLIEEDPAAARKHVARWLGSRRELAHA